VRALPFGTSRATAEEITRYGPGRPASNVSSIIRRFSFSPRITRTPIWDQGKIIGKRWRFKRADLDAFFERASSKRDFNGKRTNGDGIAATAPPLYTFQRRRAGISWRLCFGSSRDLSRLCLRGFLRKSTSPVSALIRVGMLKTLEARITRVSACPVTRRLCRIVFDTL
jgi:hypothetical protein